MNTLTSTYPFKQMTVGDSFTVTTQFQHCRVAASDYARRNGIVFSCRMQHDNLGNQSMVCHRVENNQAPVDRRGARGKRRIVTAVAEPSKDQFQAWLLTFAVGQTYIMPASFAHTFSAMEAWSELLAYTNDARFTCQRTDRLRITRVQ